MPYGGGVTTAADRGAHSPLGARAIPKPSPILAISGTAVMSVPHSNPRSDQSEEQTGGAKLVSRLQEWLPEEKTFQTKAANLNHLDWGPSSAAPFVLLHGGAWSWQEYLSLIPSLAQKWHVYALDFRGNGRSGWVPDTYRLQDFVEDNAQFLGRLKAPAVLAGHSLGGVVALMLAARFPDRVKALILEDPAITLENYRTDGRIESGHVRCLVAAEEAGGVRAELGLLLARVRISRRNQFVAAVLCRCLWQLDPTSSMSCFAISVTSPQATMASNSWRRFPARALLARRTRLGAV